MNIKQRIASLFSPKDLSPVRIASAMMKTSSWQDVTQKSKRLILSGQVQVKVNTPTYVSGVVRGDTGTYEPEFRREDPKAPHALTQSTCTCLLPGTPVVMGDGTVKRVEDLEPGDMVLSAQGNIRRVAHVMAREFDGMAVGLRQSGSTETVWVTSNHGLPTAEGFERKEAADWREGDYSFLPKPKWAGTRTQISLLDYIEDSSQYEVEDQRIGKLNKLYGNARYYAKTKPTTRFSKQVKSIPATMQLDEDFGRFCGLFVAEGMIAHNSEIRLAFNQKTEQDLAQWVAEYLRGMGLHTIVKNTNHAVDVWCTSKILADALRGLFGTGARGKRIHMDLLDAEEVFLRALWDGWVEGDGCTTQVAKTGRASLATVCPNLAMQARLILARLGHESVLRVTKDNSSELVPGGTTLQVINWKPSKLSRHSPSRFYRDEKVYQRMASPETKPYRGMVFNFEVEEDHTYVIGSGIASFNCEWETYRWLRTRQWKKLEGRMCSHLLALYWKSLATPLDLGGEEQYDHAPGQKRAPLPTDMAPEAPAVEAPLPDTDQRSFSPGETLPQPQWETPEITPGQPGIAPQPISPLQPMGPSNPRAPQRKQLDLTERGKLLDEQGNPVQQGFSMPDGRPPRPDNIQFPGTLSHVAGANGELPEGVEFVFTENQYSKTITAWIGSKPVGEIDLIDEGDYLHIAGVEVPDEYRRRGIATALLEQARKLGPVEHSQEQTEDGMAWAAKVGMGLRGDLPGGVEITEEPSAAIDPEMEHYIIARMRGETDPTRWLGHLAIAKSDGRILDIGVLEQYRRRGIAKAMLDYARNDLGLTVRHEDDPGLLTDDGRAWADKVGGLNGDLPEGLEIKVHQVTDGKTQQGWVMDGGERSRFILTAEVGGQEVGELELVENIYHGGPNGGDAFTVHNVSVAPEYIRRGIATAMLEYARANLGRVNHSESDSRSDEGDAWATKVGALTVEQFNRIPITVEAGFLDLGDGKDEFTQWYQDKTSQGLSPAVQLVRDVQLELRGGKIPMPNAVPVGMTAEGIQEYRWQDLGYDPETGQRVNAGDRPNGAPEWRNQYATMVAGKRAIIMAVEPITKMCEIMVPLHTTGKLMPHMARGWVDYKDVVAIDYEGTKDPFVRQTSRSTVQQFIDMRSASLDPENDPPGYDDYFRSKRQDAHHDGSIADGYLPVIADDLQETVGELTPGVLEGMRKAYGDLPFAGFEVHAVDPDNLSGDVARYMAGTYSWPVIAVNWDAHQEVYPRHVEALRDTIMHELVHAVQESQAEDDDWADEEEAESGWRPVV